MSEHKVVDLSQLARVRDGTGHSIFSPSSSGMWLNCSGSLVPNLLAKDDGNPDAAYGTVAHGLTEQWLKTGLPPEHMLGHSEWVEAGDWGFIVPIDEVMMAFVEECVDYCEFQPGDHLVERRVDFSPYTPIPRQKGTLDHAALVESKRMAVVTDHKFGKHQQVFAKDNTQAMIYALALALEFPWLFHDESTFVLRIAQPRLQHFDEWETTGKRLKEFGEYLRERAVLAWQLDAPRTAGEKQCKYCKIAGSCAANAKMQEDLTAAAWEDIGRPVDVTEMDYFRERLNGDHDLDGFELKVKQIGTLTTAQMAALLPYRGTAERWWKALAAELKQRAANGEDIPGYKAVEGRSKRAFINPIAALARLLLLGVPHEKMVTEKIASPAQAEKLLRAYGRKNKDIPDLLEGLISKPPGKATLVPLSDKRPAIVDISSVVFGDDDSTTETEDY